jgi:hypothetical protein
MEIDAEAGSNVKGNFNIKMLQQLSISGSVLKADLTASKLALNFKRFKCNLSGQADSAVIDVNSGSFCKADDLKITTAVAESTSGASLSLNVTDKLKVSVSSGGTVK